MNALFNLNLIKQAWLQNQGLTKIFCPSYTEQLKYARLLDNKLRTVFCAKNGSDNVYLSEIAQIYQPQTISSAELTEDGFLVYGANGIGKYKDYNHKTEQICITCRGNNMAW